MIELRAHLSQVVSNTGWREDKFRCENNEILLGAEQMEARNEVLSSALPNSTRRLIRQVEALPVASDALYRAKKAVYRPDVEWLRVSEYLAEKARQLELSA